MLIEITILLLAIPIGYLITWLAKDELILGRKWFKLIILTSIILGIFYYFIGNSTMMLTNLFIAILSVVSLMKSYDKKWTKSKI